MSNYVSNSKTKTISSYINKLTWSLTILWRPEAASRAGQRAQRHAGQRLRQDCAAIAPQPPPPPFAAAFAVSPPGVLLLKAIGWPGRKYGDSGDMSPLSFQQLY